VAPTLVLRLFIYARSTARGPRRVTTIDEERIAGLKRSLAVPQLTQLVERVPKTDAEPRYRGRTGEVASSDALLSTGSRE